MHNEIAFLRLNSNVFWSEYFGGDRNTPRGALKGRGGGVMHDFVGTVGFFVGGVLAEIG